MSYDILMHIIIFIIILKFSCISKTFKQNTFAVLNTRQKKIILNEKKCLLLKQVQCAIILGVHNNLPNWLGKPQKKS